MKGSWLLRKAWKIYQSTYSQIYSKYVELYDNEILQPRNSVTFLVNKIILKLFFFVAQPQNFHHTITRTTSQYVCTANEKPNFLLE